MIRVSALYPNETDGEFDHDYYASDHYDLVVERLSALGLKRLEIDRGVAGMEGPPPPFVAAGHLYFETAEAFEAAMEAHGEEILGDLPNFTDIAPVLQISEVARG